MTGTCKNTIFLHLCKNIRNARGSDPDHRIRATGTADPCLHRVPVPVMFLLFSF
jgi:hypothetical protein